MLRVSLSAVTPSPLASLSLAAGAILVSQASALQIGTIPGHLQREIDQKQWVQTLPVEEQPACYVELGLRGDHPTSHDVALYVEAPLDQADVDEFAARGIRVMGDLFVPPVEGRHPHGFHLAEVPHAEMAWLAADSRTVRLASAEAAGHPQNDTSTLLTGIDAIQDGECVFERVGSGVAVGFIDTGYDESLIDLPTPIEAYDVTTGDTIADWSSDVFGAWPGHGTHVAGVALSNGFYSGGTYSGGAWGSNLYFYKSAQDDSGVHFSADVIKAIDQAVAAGVQVLNISIGSVSAHLDGSSPVCQAVDSARTQGVFVVVAAGNQQSLFGHASVLLGPGESSDPFTYTIDNFLPDEYATPQNLQVIWRDDVGGDANVRLEATNLELTEDLFESYYEESVRGTEAKGYQLETAVPAGGSRTIELVLTNDATEGDPVLVHLFRFDGLGVLAPDDPAYTLREPGLADLAVTAAAWVSKTEWTDVEGTVHQIPGAVVGELAAFSSLGPRVDELAKPDLAAPGVSIVSTTATGEVLLVTNQVDDDGVIGEGESHYSVRSGTSFSAPMIAAAAALLFEAAPHLTADEVQDVLQQTASQSEAPDNFSGYCLIDAHAALQQVTGAGCFPLIQAAAAMVLEDGGKIDMRLDAGPEHADELYFLLGTVSGTDPGYLITADQTLPLNIDEYFLWTVLCVGNPPLIDGCGMLDEEGKATAAFKLNPGINPNLAGEIVHHAFLTMTVENTQSTIQFVSNAVQIELL